MEVALAKKHVVQLTGFRGDEKEALIEQIFRLDCFFIDSETFENCTHLIASKPCRSEKWLSACATGKWVLTKDYIINSARSGRWLDETTYEWGYKIERDSHYSPQMQSAPKRWRQHLTRTGALGAFSRWKVALLVKEGHKERGAFIRVLKAGHATFCDTADSSDVTHVFTTSSSLLENQVLNAPYYSVQFLGRYLLEDPIEDVSVIMTDEMASDIMHSVWKHLCFAQARHHNCINWQSSPKETNTVKNAWEIGRVTLNRIEGLLEIQFFHEAIMELHQLFPSLPPLSLCRSLLRHVLLGNVDVSCFRRLFDIFYNLLLFHPPWESRCVMQYYIDLLQCPICEAGTWAFVESLVRCFLNDTFCFCHQSDVEIDYQKRQMVVSSLLKFVATVLQEEAKFLSAKLCQCPELPRRTLPLSFTVHVFWSEFKTLKLLTKQMTSLTDLVLRCHKEISHSDKFVFQEVRYHLNMMLGAAVEYWILLGFYLNKHFVNQVANDLAYYICVSCEDFSVKEKEKLIYSIQSPWLQILVAELVFKNLCIKSGINLSSEPLSLGKLIFAYIPALWSVGACGTEEVRKIQRKGKIGHRSCLESQRALLMLNGENHNQSEVLLDLPLYPKLRRKTEARSDCVKENIPTAVSGLPHNYHNTKGETALHTACRNNKVKKLITLLSIPGTDINVKDNAGWTPLHEACNHGSTECVREILQRCPEVDLLSHVDGVTPLHDALLNGHVEIGKLLLQYGGPIILRQKDVNGKFPLDYVISAQVKKELFDIVEINESIEDFHKKAAHEFDKHKIEFSAFLLSRMLLNFRSLFGLPCNSLSAKTVYSNAASLISHVRANNTTNSFSNSLVERYLEAIVTMQNIGDPVQAFPETLLHTAGLNLQILMATLRTLTSNEPLSHDQQNLP
ncbi:SMC5-SMC6 complex localization factor protein 1 [Spea bombifrons]|uniref:SMC5-SMC6 complex localization factor protein 1 n=1 Tax=Spea bombifrons TaxID=233779 RepID=UPI00234ABC6B|nr:SMC5-SMC6 complex localization factor protein 1 [Spea bombifrons]